MHIYSLSNAADRSTTGGTGVTMLGIGSPSTRRVKIIEVWAAFSSVTATDQPVEVELLTCTSAGTSTAGTPSPIDKADPVALCSGFENCSIEPSGISVMFATKISPIGTTMIYQTPLGQEITLLVSSFFGVRLNSPQSQSGIRLTIKFQE